MKMLTMLIVALLAYAENALACLAEFGTQHTIPGLKSAADLSGNQYCAVRLTATANQINLASEVAGVSGVGKRGIGILQNKPKTNEAATVAYMGLSKWVSGNTVTAGALVTYNSSGKCLDAVSGDLVMGTALDAATVDGQVISVVLFPPIRWGAVA